MRLSYGEETLFRMFSQLMTAFEKEYLYLSQERMIELLREYHDYDIKRRMLGYNLASLIKKDLINRRSRNLRAKDGSIQPLTTLTFVTKRGHKLLVNRIKQAYRAANKTVKKILRAEWQRQPHPAEQPLSLGDSIEKARELLATLA